MKHYIFKSKIDIESVESLLSFINSTEDNITILVDTQGGENTLTEYLLIFLNENKDRITLMAGNEITSNGFWLFYKFQGKKIISPSTFSLIHEAWQEFPTYALKDKKSSQYESFKELKEINKNSLKILKQFLNKKEVKWYKKGFDVYLNSKRLNKIFNNEL